MQANATETASSRTAVDETALKLGALLRALFVFDRGAQLRAMDESGLTFTQCKVLFVLSGTDGESGDCPGKDLAERVGLSMATISRSVDGLVAGGHVTRVEDPDDRRVRRIAITKSGEEVVERVLSARLEGLRKFSETLNAAERRKLDSALNLLLERDELAGTYQQLKEIES